MSSEEIDALADRKQAIISFVRCKATHKTKITILLNKLKS